MTPSRSFLRLSDVLRIWGQERARAHARANGQDEEAAVAAARPVAEATYRDYYRQSLAGRYVDRPMPMPSYPEGGTRRGQHPLWVPEQGETLDDLEQRLRTWWNSRPGAGAGSGPPRLKFTPAEARVIARQFAESGLSVVKFARQLGVARSTLYDTLRRAADGAD